MLRVSIVVVLVAALAAGSMDPHIQEMYETMPTEKFIQYFNNHNLSLKITQHDMEPFKGGVIANFDYSEFPVIEHEASSDLPENFDARKNWPQCVTIKDIYHQGNCSSCWTFGSATTASDRTCIHKNITVRLSEQDFECCKNCFVGKNICDSDGGIPGYAFKFWIHEGLVTQECKPYDIEALKRGECTKKCVNGKDYTADKRKGSSVAQVVNTEDTIKMELFKNGPIETSFPVYRDFHDHYSKGVYEYKFGEQLGFHSVRVIGYGVENGVKYWLAANSWGIKWGEEGLFKWKRYQKLDFESAMLSCMP